MSAEGAGPCANAYVAQLEELAKCLGVRPIGSVDELRADVFGSDRELDEFLADLRTFRRERLT